MVHTVKGEQCTLDSDAWTDATEQNVINYVLLCGKDSNFLESVYTGSTSHDAKLLSRDTRRVIQATVYETISTAVSYNTTAAKLVWETLQRDYPDVFFHRCISYVIHLAVKDLVARLSWVETLFSDCRSLVKFFKKNQQLWAELRSCEHLEGLQVLVMPADTRWGTIEKCFASVLESEAILNAFISSRGFLKGKTKKQKAKAKAKRRMAHDVVKGFDFVQHLKKDITILCVLSKFQKVFERNTRPISDVYRMLIDLPATSKDIKMPLSEFGVITTVLEDRFDIVYGDAHGASYLLDPRYAGEGMDADTCEAVAVFIATWHGSEQEEATTLEFMQCLAALQQPTREL
jgi:hypothetical protein